MTDVLSVILPILVLVLAGYAAARFRVVPTGGAAALEFLVFYVGMPALFLRFVSGARVEDAPILSFALTTTFATYCAFAVAFSFGALINRGRIPEATVLGLAGSYSNLGYMAPAVAIAALGLPAALPMALIFCFDHALIALLVPAMMALGGTQRADGRAIVWQTARRIFLHPLVIATVLGLIIAYAGIALPRPIDAVLATAGSAGPAAALLALGMGLGQRPVARPGPDVPIVLAAKLILHPLIVYLLLSWIGGFDRAWVNAAMLLAALPPAVNVLSLARRYDTFADRASMAVLYGTAASAVTLTVALALVAGGVLPVDPFH
jgi:malonate transporter